MKKAHFLIALVGFAQSFLFASNYEETVQEMSHAITDLPSKGYLFVDLGVSAKDLALIQSLEVGKWQTYNRFGNIDRMKAELPEFFHLIGNQEDKVVGKATEILYQLVSNIILASKKQTAWVCIRAALPTSEFDIPRWHMDGAYYSPYDSLQYKFAAALKGSQTLFFPLTDDNRNIYLENHANRDFLSQFFDSRLAEVAESCQGAFFLVGNQKSAALHSEPCIQTPRIFISVLPGDDSEIEELNCRWNSL